MTTTFTAITDTELANITGGAARSSGSDNSKIQLLLTQLTDSIRDVASSKSSTTDQLMPMMMMLMMTGGGGGASAPAAPPAPTQIRVNVRR